MFRRCISLFVIVGLLAGQLALIPHAHGGLSSEEQQKHDATPHIHCNWLGHDHHGHDHSHGRHSHQHEHPSNSESEPTDKPLPEGVAVTDHDASAIYVSTHASAVATGKQHDLPTSSLMWTAVCACQGIISAIGWGNASFLRRPPDAVLDGSGTYLTLRNLRI